QKTAAQQILPHAGRFVVIEPHESGLDGVYDRVVEQLVACQQHLTARAGSGIDAAQPPQTLQEVKVGFRPVPEPRLAARRADRTAVCAEREPREMKLRYAVRLGPVGIRGRSRQRASRGEREREQAETSHGAAHGSSLPLPEAAAIGGV